MTRNGASEWSGRKVLVLTPTPTHPVDFGNRRRIYQVCRRIKNLGAEIHLLHYPSESDWRSGLPEGDQRAMQREWDGYYVAAVTRPLHCDPKGEDHTIDEWWDPAVGDVVKWLCSVSKFDVFIVNYIWLSKAFEFVPRDMVKILDTHDKLANRRELLASYGIAREFFHLTETEEAFGVNRADIIWAIKQEEEEYFRGLTAKRVLTMLHAEPVRFASSRTNPEIVRFGIVGARNSINVANIRAFLRVADELIKRTLLPCEILIAGSCCDGLADEAYAGVTIVGRVDSMAAFYDSVDVVLVPMEFSTGLKIKVAEAMAFGKPVISHLHAFEGYVPTHEFHSLPSFEAMLAACREVIKDSTLINELARASVLSVMEADRLVSCALEESLAASSPLPRSMCFVLPLSALHTSSLVLDHVLEAAEYVAHQCPVMFFVDHDEFDGAESAAVEALRRFGPVMLSPKAAEAVGDCFKLFKTHRPPTHKFATLMSEDHVGFWLVQLPADLAICRTKARAAVVPVGLLAATGTAIDAACGLLQEKFEELFVFDYDQSRALAAFSPRAAGCWQIPVLWRGHLSTALQKLRQANRTSVAVFADDDACPLASLVIDILLAQTSAPVLLLCRKVAGARSWPGRVSVMLCRGFIKRIPAEACPYLAVDVALADGFSPLRELFERANVPVVQLCDETARDERASDQCKDRVAGLWASVLMLCEAFASRSDGEPCRTRSLGNDVGWALIWQLVGRLKEAV